MFKIIDVEYVQDYSLSITFNNHETRRVNLESELVGEVFGPLKDKKLFIQYTFMHTAIEWVNGADFAPEYLFELGVKQMSGKLTNTN